MKKEFFGITESHYISLSHIKDISWRKNDFLIEGEISYCVIFTFYARISDVQIYNIPESKLNELKKILEI